MNNNPLGRIQLHDPKSRNYPYSGPQAEGKSIHHRFDAKNLDQFYTSGCVGFSGANLLNTNLAFETRKAYNMANRRRPQARATNDDGLNNYHHATLNDPFDWEYPPTDEGSSALGLMKYWQSIGAITSYEWAFSFDQFLAAIQHQPVLLGTNWYDSMFEPDKAGVVYPSGKPVGGHEYLATSIDFRRHVIGFQNSWGETWGRKGAFYMSFHAVETLLAEGGDVAIPKLL